MQPGHDREPPTEYEGAPSRFRHFHDKRDVQVDPIRAFLPAGGGTLPQSGAKLPSLLPRMAERHTRTALRPPGSGPGNEH